MRIRSVKPEFWQSETLASVSKESKLIAIAILNYADDEGYFFDVPQVMRGALFPFDEDSTSIRRALDDLSRIGYIRRGTAECGKRVAHIVNFRSHQKIDRPQPSKIAGLAITWDVFDEHSTSVRRAFAVGMEGKGEGEGKEIQGENEKPKRKRFSPDEFDHLLSNAMRSNATFLQEWHRWNEYRNKRKKRISEDAAKEQIRDIHEAGISAGIAAIRKSIASDWQGLFLGDAVGQAQKPSTPVRTMQDLITAGELKPIYRGPCPGLYADEDGANV